MTENNKKSKKKVKLPVRAYLLYLFVVTLLLTGVTFSKYITTSEGGDQARVVTMGNVTITETGDFADGKGMIIPGVDLKKEAVVSFEGSENATYVFLEIILPTVWSADSSNYEYSIYNGNQTMMNWSIDSGWSYLLAEQEKQTYVYYRALQPNQVLEADIIAEEGKITVSDRITEAEMNNMTDISIAFRATVVQSSGFESIEDAWESVASK